ncbi:hypothetical protein LPJ59_004408 [Coemansia sp. RSA 2399]|nr:hypothetical protein LPJ59_004408 [Coemansia sp. RSA 2399]KAJ1899412.1 hypothetical protein LPJ81_004148 [Coemansia sp. IMI 209127]
MTQFYIPSNAPEQCMYYGYTVQEQQHNQFFHPAVRQEMALDMSLKKLHSIKQAQRSSHRQADLLKTVLVYNMFKAAMCSAPTQNTNNNYKNSADCGLDMDVDISGGNEGSQWASSVRAVDDVQMDQDSETAAAEAAEQSWFDRCIDRVLTEDEQDVDYGQPETDGKKPQDVLFSRGLEFSAAADDGLLLEDATVASPTEEYIDGSAGHIVPDTGSAGPTLKRSPSSASIQSLRMQQKQNDENALLLLATASSHHNQQRHRASTSNDTTDDAVIGGGPTTASYTVHVSSHPWQYANLYNHGSNGRTASLRTTTAAPPPHASAATCIY